MIKETARFVSRESRILVGVRQIVQVPAPAVGLDWTTVVPAGEQWRILSALTTFTTSAVVANREVALRCNIDGLDAIVATSGFIQTTGVTRTYSWFTGAMMVAAGAGSTQQSVGLPLVWLPQNTTIGTTTAAIDVGDQYGVANFYVERLYLTDQQLEVVAEEEARDYFASMGAAT